MPRIVTMMQAAYRGYICRAKWAQRKCAVKIQMFYRRYVFRKYFRDLQKTFRDVKSDKNYGKNFNWPNYPKVLNRGVDLLHKIHACWRAKMMITALTPQEQAHMRQKVHAYDIFKGNKYWDIPRKFEAAYLEKETNPYREQYKLGMTNLFATYGDTVVMFADYAMKVNKVGKSQKRGIVVTEKNIYKHDPKKYTVKKFETPLAEVTHISMSPNRDTFVVVHLRYPYRDLVLDLGIDGEKVSEFVTVVVQEILKITGNTLRVDFTERISYNNSRTKEKPGTDCTLTFQATTDAKQKGSVFKTGKNNGNTVLYV